MKPSEHKEVPQGDLTIRTMAMPAYTNPHGDIFGGWVLSQMDLAGASLAYETAKCRVATVAIDAMSFISPVHVGDYLCCYAELLKIGNTSITVKVEAWAKSAKDSAKNKVTQGTFVFVAIDTQGKPQSAKPDQRAA